MPANALLDDAALPSPFSPAFDRVKLREAMAACAATANNMAEDDASSRLLNAGTAMVVSSDLSTNLTSRTVHSNPDLSTLPSPVLMVMVTR